MLCAAAAASAVYHCCCRGPQMHTPLPWSTPPRSPARPHTSSHTARLLCRVVPLQPLGLPSSLLPRKAAVAPAVASHAPRHHHARPNATNLTGSLTAAAVTPTLTVATMCRWRSGALSRRDVGRCARCCACADVYIPELHTCAQRAEACRRTGMCSPACGATALLGALLPNVHNTIHAHT
jgi:hypothetical protein